MDPSLDKPMDPSPDGLFLSDRQVEDLVDQVKSFPPSMLAEGQFPISSEQLFGLINRVVDLKGQLEVAKSHHRLDARGTGCVDCDDAGCCPSPGYPCDCLNDILKGIPYE